jgi:hypothetical protein
MITHFATKIICVWMGSIQDEEQGSQIMWQLRKCSLIYLNVYNG